MREPRHLLCCINVQPGASPLRRILETLSELFISNWALDLAALSIPELKIIWAAVTATISPMFCNFFSAVLSMGVTSQIRGRWKLYSCSRLWEIYWLFANTEQTVLRLRNNRLKSWKSHTTQLKQPLLLLCCLMFLPITSCKKINRKKKYLVDIN